MATRVDSDAPPELAEENVDPLDYTLRVLRRWVQLIAVVVISFVGMALGYTFVQTPMYEASTSLVVERPNPGDTLGLSGEVQGLQQLTLTMVELVQSRPVAEAVIRELDLQTSSRSLLANLSAEQVNGTQVIRVTYADPSPERAQRIANAAGEVFSEQVSGESFVADDIAVSVWERAALPAEPVSPKPVRNVGAALVVGTMLGIGLAFLLEHMLMRKSKRYNPIYMEG